LIADANLLVHANHEVPDDLVGHRSRRSISFITSPEVLLMVSTT
jgi:hypothetical protein